MKMLSSFHCSLHSLIDLFINAFPAPELLMTFFVITLPIEAPEYFEPGLISLE